MTNPNNALGTNAALGGRTSVDAFNDAISSLTRGVVSGFAVTPSSAMTLNVGGTAGVRDVAVAVSPNGNRVSVDNRTTSPIKVTMAAASASSARIDAIVAYVNSPSQVTATTPDNPTACGIIPVSGTAAAQPTDSAIRTAISDDGGTGSTAYYAIIAIVRLAANTTTITSNMITMQKSRIADGLVTNASIADKAIKSDKVDWTTLYKTATPLSATLPVQANSETDVLSFTLPAGKWRIFWAVRGYGDSAQTDMVYAGLKADGEKVQSLVENIATTGALRPYISCSYELNTTDLKTVKTYIQMPMDGSISVDTTYLFALRVG